MARRIVPGGIDANLAPDAFRRWSRDYYEARRSSFGPSDAFSPVPYFLLCRAIELAIKAAHVITLSQEQVRKRFGHKLAKAYDALAPTERILDASEERILRTASAIYAGKGFEYFDPEDALNGFRRYPNLEELDAVARKLLRL